MTPNQLSEELRHMADAIDKSSSPSSSLVASDLKHVLAILLEEVEGKPVEGKPTEDSDSPDVAPKV
jgi:hypothetical protein